MIYSLYAGTMPFKQFRDISKLNGLVNLLDSALGFCDPLLFPDTQIHIVEMRGKKRFLKPISLCLNFIHICLRKISISFINDL